MKRLLYFSIVLLIQIPVCAQYSEIWGTAFTGGSNDAGFIFKMDANGGNYQIKHHFDGVDGGRYPKGVLSEGPDGKLYGITSQGGLQNNGVIYSFDRDYNSFNVENHLNINIGAKLLLNSDGKFYVMSSYGNGSIYTYDPISKTLALAHDFPTNEGKFVFNESQPILVKDHLIYGTTGAGGISNEGVLFEYNLTTGIYTVKHHFENATGKNPDNFITYHNGKIYGTSGYGGNNSRGVLFEYNIDSDAYTVKKHLESVHALPAGISLGSDNNLYITISIGGSLYGGGICKYDPIDNTLNFVREWVDEGDPSIPIGSLMTTFDGKMFGATRYGGTGERLGVIYEYDTTSESVIIKQSLNDGYPSDIVLLEVGERPVTSLTINAPADKITIDNGTLQLSVGLEPEEAKEQPVVWSVDDPSVASISSAGMLTANSNGLVTVTATANFGLGVSSSKQITISNQDSSPPIVLIESLEITAATYKISSFSSTLQLNTNVYPTNASDSSVTWYVSDNGIASISATGLLTPISAGTITITALANDDSGKYDTKEIEILNNVTSITISPSTNTISDPYGSIDFDAIVLPNDASNKNITWSLSNSSVGGSIDQNGVLTAQKNGKVYVIAKSTDGSSIIAEHTVTITNQESGTPVDTVSISTPSNSIATDGGTLQCAATVLPINATNKTLNWYCVPIGIATVDQNGLVTPLKNGTVTVVAKSINSAYGTKTITITNQSSGPFPLTKVALTPESETINVKGGTLQLNYELIPGNTTDTNLIWGSSKESIATVSEDGLVTVISDGTAQIYAYTYNLNSKLIISNYALITVTNQTDPEILVTAIDITSSTNSIDVKDGTLQLSESILPLDATDKTISWSVDDENVATISSTGMLTALDNGSVKVTAMANDGSGVIGTKQITITNQEDIILVNSILLTSLADIIDAKNGTLQLSATKLPIDASDKTVSWTVDDENIASISSTGILTALSNGTVTVTAIANDGSDVFGTKQITVTNQEDLVLVSSIVLSTPTDIINSEDGILQLSATILPIDASVKTISWSVDDENVASISSTGLLTALHNGTVTITATANDGSGVFGTKQITITNQAAAVLVSSIMLSSSSDIINSEDGTLQITATILPINATDKTISWSVDDENVASISSTGLLTALYNGTVTITATANDGSGVFGTKQITITNQEDVTLVNSIPLSSPFDYIDVKGGFLQLTAMIEASEAKDKTISWTVDDASVASISSWGMLTALDNGTVTVTITITANDGSGIFGTKQITITNQEDSVPINSILLSSPADIIGAKNGALQLSVTILPINATNKTINWTVDDENIASISSTGILTALDNGTVRVTATSTDGSGVFGTKQFTITNQEDKILVNSILLASPSDTIDIKKGTLQFVATVTSLGVVNTNVTWSIDDISKGFISDTGLFTAYEDGDVIVSATAMDGSGAIASKTITITNQSIGEFGEVVRTILYPNPTSDKIRVLTDDPNKITEMAVYALTGRKLLESLGHEIDVQTLPIGIYTIVIQLRNRHQSVQLFQKK